MAFLSVRNTPVFFTLIYIKKDINNGFSNRREI
jgi:hypothetical protein